MTGALATLLRERGEQPAEVVVSVPITSRRTAGTQQLGNQTGVVPLAIPTLPDREARFRRITELSHADRGGHRGSSAAPMGLVFRALAAMRLFQVFIDHQRLVHTFVTNVRGPQDVIRLASCPVESIIPMAITPGNVGVCFDVLSYAGKLVLTVVADTGVVPEQERLTSLLAEEFASLGAVGPTS